MHELTNAERFILIALCVILAIVVSYREVMKH
jgi:hypothetical protein